MQVKRVDPLTCGCTDCQTGYSVPLSQATNAQVDALIDGRLLDGVGRTITEYDFDIFLASRGM